MRYSRIIATFILSSALILCLVFPSSASEVDTLICESGVGHFYSPNSANQKWVDYYPTENNGVYTFSDIPYGTTSGNIEYAFYSFTFLTYSDYTPVTLERGYVYTFNFKITSTKISSSNADRTTFSFGMCEASYTNALPLSSVTYTYSTASGRSTFNCTAVVNVDGSIDFSSLTSNDGELYYYLQIIGPWSDNFTLTSSNMTKTKNLGEESYYQASVDAIENLPQTEYDYVYNNMPNAEGDIDQIKGNLDELTEELHLLTSDLYEVLLGISDDEPLIYMPPMQIPVLDINLRTAKYFGNYIDGNGYFHPLSMVNSMAPSFTKWVEVGRSFVQLSVIIGFVTIGLDKMLKIEWWM